MRPDSDASSLPADDAATLASIPDCEQIDLLLPDMNGLLRGKRITAMRWRRSTATASACRCR